AGRVGKGARLADRADECRDAAVVTSKLEDLLDHGAVLRPALPNASVRRLGVGVPLDLDEEPALRIGSGSAGDAAMQSLERDGTTASGGAETGPGPRDG